MRVFCEVPFVAYKELIDVAHCWVDYFCKDIRHGEESKLIHGQNFFWLKSWLVFFCQNSQCHFSLYAIFAKHTNLPAVRKADTWQITPSGSRARFNLQLLNKKRPKFFSFSFVKKCISWAKKSQNQLYLRWVFYFGIIQDLGDYYWFLGLHLLSTRLQVNKWWRFIYQNRLKFKR